MIDESLTTLRDKIRDLTKEINKKQREVHNLVAHRQVLKEIFRKRQIEVRRYLKAHGLWEGSNFRD
jgi:hypothetical protein